MAVCFGLSCFLTLFFFLIGLLFPQPGNFNRPNFLYGVTNQRAVTLGVTHLCTCVARAG